MKKNFNIQSRDAKTIIHGACWEPDGQNGKPKAVVQLIHGMAEYIERYDLFAKALNEANMVAIGHDHIGHGQSVDPSRPMYGYFEKENGARLLVEDANAVTQKAKALYPDRPVFILGHSMGSFVLRNLIQVFPDEAMGVIIMGTGGRRVGLTPMIRVLQGLNQCFPKVKNAMVDAMVVENPRKHFEDVETKWDWLSSNKENVKRYIEDPKTGFLFTNNGFYTLLKLLDGATKEGWAKKVRIDLPILLISGKEDLVGDKGVAPRMAADALKAAGVRDVVLKLYTGLRHELLQEKEQRMVFADIIEWLEQHKACCPD